MFSINHIVERLKLFGFLNFIAFVVLVLILLTSIFRPIIGWDSWYYHLPFSSYLLNIGGGENSFIVSEHIYQRYLGFPKASELLQGALWYFTGSLNYITLINSLSFLFLVKFLVIRIKVKISDLVFGLLAMPILGVHVISSYNDLFSGILICLQVISSGLIYEKLLKEKKDFNLKNYSVDIIIFSSSAILAGNTKYMSWLVSILVTIFLLIIVNFKKIQTRSTRLILSKILIVIIFLSSISIIKNYIFYSNPFYPVKTVVPILNIEFDGPETTKFTHKSEYPGYLDNFGLLSRPIYFFLSITEIDWYLRGLKKEYNIDSNTGDKPLRFRQARTGGLWGIFIIVNLCLSIFLFYLVKRKSVQLSYFDKYLFCIFLFLFFVTLFMPRSHQIRYYFYWPILLIILNIHFFAKIIKKKLLRYSLSIFFLTCFLINYSVLHVKGLSIYPFSIREQDYMSKKLKIIDYDRQNITKILDKTVLEKLENEKNICLGREFNPIQFMYSQAVIGGDHKIEQAYLYNEKCRVFPNVNKIKEAD